MVDVGAGVSWLLPQALKYPLVCPFWFVALLISQPHPGVFPFGFSSRQFQIVSVWFISCSSLHWIYIVRRVASFYIAQNSSSARHLSSNSDVLPVCI